MGCEEDEELAVGVDEAGDGAAGASTSTTGWSSKNQGRGDADDEEEEEGAPDVVRLTARGNDRTVVVCIQARGISLLLAGDAAAEEVGRSDEDKQRTSCLRDAADEEEAAAMLVYSAGVDIEMR